MTQQPISVNYLLAVWGDTYIRQFMDLSLRSLLSENNIPALARQTRSRFTFLTRKADKHLFTSHHLFRRLSRCCEVDFITIDDLIFNGNYSATLTLAYERGMRATGERMLSTYFIYLVADYVMADGSLLNLLPHMQRGVSGITAGNFQVVEEDVLNKIQKRISKTTGTLTLAPRELMSLSLPHLHPIAVANLMDQDYSHTQHTNRLFWRVDNDTLIARFYLRHMLCIRPEISDYIIGSSCDYSYIAEMCPSGNVVHIADSDEYCVIELQPFTHEEHFIRNGPSNPHHMAPALAEWLTSTHRNNIFLPVIFHAGDITESAYQAVEDSRRQVEYIDKLLPDRQQPTRGHPYWISCIEGILAQLATRSDQKRFFKNGTFAGIIGSPVFEPPLGNNLGDYHLLKMERFRYGRSLRNLAIRFVLALSGNTANAHFWHREAGHSRRIKKAIRKAAAYSERFLLVAFDPTSYASWCRRNFPEKVILQKASLFTLRNSEHIAELLQGAGHAVILLPIEHERQLGEVLARCMQHLEGAKKVTLIITSRYFLRSDRHFRDHLAQLAAYYNSGMVKVESFTTISNPSRRLLDGIYRKQVNRIIHLRPSLRALLRNILTFSLLLFTCVGYALGNIMSISRRYPNGSNPTCGIVTFTLRKTRE